MKNYYMDVLPLNCYFYFYLRASQLLSERNDIHRPIRLTQCCTQFKSPGDKILCVLYLHYNVAFTFKWYGNYWNKTFYSQRVWIGYNIELAEQVYCHVNDLPKTPRNPKSLNIFGKLRKNDENVPFHTWLRSWRSLQKSGGHRFVPM